MTSGATISTFMHGTQAVEIARLPLPNGRWCLLVNGPGSFHHAEECLDATTTMTQQAREERRLTVQGFRLERILSAIVS